jgi:pimeloyl-ACP methyl ester carboxylesterase
VRTVIEDFPMSGEKASRVILREALATAAAGLLYPLGWLGGERRTARRAEQRTVVFVHGYLGNPSTFLPLRGYLRAHGIGATLSYRYPPGVGAEAAAIGLRHFLRRRVRGGRIDLVCHSLGGVVARIYLQELGGARRVDNCVTLAAPHRGTYSAYWLTSRVARDLRPGSPLLARLEKTKAAAAAVRFLAIVGGSDNIVVPRVFGGLDEAVLHVPGLGHIGLLFSPITFRAVLDRLAPPETVTIS